jgi:hypothetical protein
MKRTSALVAALVLIAAIVGISSTHVSASTITPGLTITADSGIVGYWTGSIGYQFTANSNVAVNALGMYAPTGDSSGSQVGLWDASGNLLASTTIQFGDPIVSGFQWDSITPVNLKSGNNYLVGGLGYYTFNEGYATDPRISYVQDAWAFNGSGLVFPDQVEFTPGGFPGGNVSLSAVPEPGTITLAGFGMVCLAGLAWRRRQKAVA